MERWLVRKFPLRREHVIEVKPCHCAGYHRIKKGVSRIVIDSEMPDYAQGWTLLHEWAHAREDPKHRGKHHGRHWGRRYQPIYSAWFDKD